MLQAYIASSDFWFRKVHEGQPGTPAERSRLSAKHLGALSSNQRDQSLGSEAAQRHATSAREGDGGAHFPHHPSWLPSLVHHSRARRESCWQSKPFQHLAVCDLAERHPDLDLWGTLDVYPL
jgi:hypothetical protein